MYLILKRSVSRLNLPENKKTPLINSVQLRRELRQHSYEEWASLSWQDIGVMHFEECKFANNFMVDKIHLSSSEWTSILKLNVNYANLRGVPGNNLEKNGSSLCRRCSKETETPSHVLGSCPFNSLLITRRHHKIKHIITGLLQKKRFDCYEEVHAIDSNGLNRFADILVFPNNTKEAYILDPTIRYENNKTDQALLVDQEKDIYEACIPFYKEKYAGKYGIRNFTVYGLLFGARGTMYKHTADILKTFGIEKADLNFLAESIIADSIGIIHHHIYQTSH